MRHATANVVGMARLDNPVTSVLAAEKVSGRRWTIRQRVEDFARRLPHGFIDEEVGMLDPNAPESSFRKRRTELADENIIIDSGETRRNSKGQDCIVWRHRMHMTNPPPQKPREAKPSRFTLLQEENARLRAQATAAQRVECALATTFLRDKAQHAESEGRYNGLIAAADSLERGEHRA